MEGLPEKIKKIKIKFFNREGREMFEAKVQRASHVL